LAYAGNLDLTGRVAAGAASSQDEKFAVQKNQMAGEPADEADALVNAAQNSSDSSVDDGSFELLVGLRQPGTIYFINRLQPPSYPATLSQLKIYFAGGNSNLSPGAAITLLVGSNPGGDENINGTSFQQINASIQSLNQFNVYNVPNIIINSGNFVVGFRMQIPANVYPGALDTTPPSRRRSYLSTDGFNFALTEDRRNDLDGNAGNWGIRAVVNTPPTGLAGLVASFNNASSGDNGTGDISIIRDLSGSGFVSGSIGIHGVSSEVVIAPNGRYAIASPTGNTDSISIITGLEQSNPVESRVLQMGDAPSAVAITPDSTTAIVVNAFTRPVTYRIVTGLPDAPNVSGLFPILLTRFLTNDSGAEDVALSPSGDTAIISLFSDDQVAVIDGIRSGSPSLRAKVDVRNGPNGVAFAPDGNTAFVASSLDNSISVISGLQPGSSPYFVRAIREGVGGTPQAIGLTPDGSKAVVTNTGDNTVSIFTVSGDTLSFLTRLGVGVAPAGLSISSDGQMALVANANSRTVSVIRGLGTLNPFVATTLGPAAALDTATFVERSVALAGTPTAGPILDVTPTSLTFNTVVGQGNPSPQQITVRNLGSGSLSFNVTSSDPNLVTTSPVINSTVPAGQSQTINVFVNNPNQPGTRQAFLTFNAPGAQNSPRTVTVTVNTTSPPAILNVTPTSLTFNAVVGQGNPPSQQITVSNAGSGSLSFNVSTSDSSLVNVSPANGTLFGGQSQTVTVFATNPNQPGTRQAFLTFNAPGAQNSPQTVTVTVNTTSPPAILDVTPTSLTFNAVIGQGNPPSQQITVRNTGSGSFTFNVSTSDSSLVNVSPSNGTLFGGQQQTVTVFVNNPNQPGTRQAFLTINAPGAQNSPQTVTVTVNTTSPPAVLDVTPTSLTFNAVIGQGNPPSQQMTVRNTGSGSFTFNVSSSDSSLVNVSPANGTLFGGQSQTVTVFATNPNQTGTRQAFLTFNAPGAQNSPRTVTVTVNTTGAPPILNVSPTSLSFNAVVGQGNPPPQQITVQNNGGSSLSFTITSNNASVSVSPANGTLFSGQSQPVQVFAINPNSPGTINAQLTVTASGAQNSPQYVNVTINTPPGGGQDFNEPNDNPQSATFLNVPPPGQSVSMNGNATPDDFGASISQIVSECDREGVIQDWFRLQVSQRDAFQVSLVFQSTDADFDLYWFIQSNDFANFPQGVQLITFSALGPGQQETLGARVLEPGTYFIGVSRVHRNTSSDVLRIGYTLTLTRGLSPALHAIEDVACAGFTVDDATTNGYYVVNRVRPTRYPARLESISALFFPHQGRPSPNGRPVRIIAFADQSGSGVPPFNPSLLINQTIIINLPSDGRGRFNTLSLGANGPVINQGDFYVGYVVDTPNGIFPDAGRVVYPDIRSFASVDGGHSYQQLNIQDTGGQLFNVAIRATVNTNPFGNTKMSAAASDDVQGSKEVELALPRPIYVDVR
jgi:hypothetical protein